MPEQIQKNAVKEGLYQWAEKHIEANYPEADIEKVSSLSTNPDSNYDTSLSQKTQIRFHVHLKEEGIYGKIEYLFENGEIEATEFNEEIIGMQTDLKYSPDIAKELEGSTKSHLQE